MYKSFAADLVKVLLAKSDPNTILVTFRGDHAAAIYPKSILELIKTEPAVIDITDLATGEILYINPA